MEIVKTKIEITIDGTKHLLKAAKAKDASNFADSVSADKKLSNGEMIEKTQSFLCSMGLPKDVCEDLELDHLNKVIEFITKKK
jgi:hypothetical protein